ncbi:solute carrier family 66 member 3 isoform X2 [Pieris napi]|uniref:solute carrier family 66 member 3 isoform X2 n=1 Tax=Pieris napi TaxID=78633 RepID=UPI001FB96F3C|nr:solute carrier family 66 member 3 isoform X2 [Pieris napi]
MTNMDTWKVEVQAFAVDFLNWTIVLTCLFLKVPQIFHLKNKRPSEIKGLSLQAIAMEIVGYSIMALYNFKNKYTLNTYLEYLALLIQEYIMLFYVLRAKGHLANKYTSITAVIYIVSVSAFLIEIIPMETLNYLVPLCLPLSGVAKVTYIVGMIRASNSDAISMETWAMSALTNAGRFFTVFMDSADKHLLLNYSVSVILSSAVLGTAVYYQLQVQTPMIATRRREPSVRRHYHVD